MAWGNTSVIKTPQGDYVTQSDDLTKELLAAATKCSYASFRVFINGIIVDDPSGLQTNSVAALADQARIEGIEPEVRIGVYNKPA